MTKRLPRGASSNVRDRIVAAAVELLHEHGIHALTQQRVSELAGVRQSHLTYYFPVRGDLLKQAVIAGMASLLAVIEGPPAEHATLEEFHEALVAQASDRRMARMMAGLVVASEEDKALKPWLEQFEADMLDKLLRAFHARGLKPKREALELLQATFIGALTLDLAASSVKSQRRMRATFNAAFAALKNGARAAAGVRRPSVARRPQRRARR
jgi:AcrR family transcriptional regulator